MYVLLTLVLKNHFIMDGHMNKWWWWWIAPPPPPPTYTGEGWANLRLRARVNTHRQYTYIRFVSRNMFALKTTWASDVDVQPLHFGIIDDKRRNAAPPTCVSSCFFRCQKTKQAEQAAPRLFTISACPFHTIEINPRSRQRTNHGWFPSRWRQFWWLVARTARMCHWKHRI